MIALRDYQLDALAAIHTAAARGTRRQAVVIPTGTGKTIIFAELLRERVGRGLVLVHRDELVRQTLDKLQLVAPDAHVGVVKGEANDVDASIVVASVQTLARDRRLAQLRPDFRTVVVDEAHHVAAESYQRILEHVDVGAPLMVGVTATPERADGAALDGWVIVYRRELLEMIQAGYLADLHAIRVTLTSDFGSLHVRAGDYVERETEALLLDGNAPALAAEVYLTHASGRRAVVFTPTVRVAHDMAAAFASAGVRAAALDGGTPLERRREILARFHDGSIAVVANCGVLTEGFDEPAVDCIIVARPTRSRPLYMQMIGRGTRPYPGKRDCLVIDMEGATNRHDLLTVATALGISRVSTLAQRGVLAAVEEEREAQRRLGADHQLGAEMVDLFRRRPLHWVAAGAGRFTLTLGHELLVLEQAGGRWDVRVRGRDSERVLATALPIEYAQGTGEDYARKVGARALVDPRARWRTERPTERQLSALRRRGIPSRPTLTRGEASDLLTASFAGASR